MYRVRPLPSGFIKGPGTDYTPLGPLDPNDPNNDALYLGTRAKYWADTVAVTHRLTKDDDFTQAPYEQSAEELTEVKRIERRQVYMHGRKADPDATPPVTALTGSEELFYEWQDSIANNEDAAVIETNRAAYVAAKAAIKADIQ